MCFQNAQSRVDTAYSALGATTSLAAMYTIEDLNNANLELEAVAARWSAAYAASRANPFDAEARAAAEKVREIDEDLKRRGVLPYTEHKLIEETLDASYPHAQSREVVLLNGKRYRRRFYPLEKSSTGKTVQKWRKVWEPLDD